SHSLSKDEFQIEDQKELTKQLEFLQQKFIQIQQENQQINKNDNKD
ncbi:5181_t:CDS:1, partial [Entrophospora sp. SA101]